MDDTLKVERFCLGELSTNCYLVYNPLTKNGFLVDIADDSPYIRDFIDKNGLRINFIIITHGHIDHIRGLEFFDFPFYIHKADRDFLKNPELNFSHYLSTPFTVDKEPLLITENISIHFDGRELVVFHTPGHTPGSLSIKIADKVFVGDLLFFSSVGRTDIPLASHEELISSIKEKILTLDDNTTVFPGHGPITSVGRERKYNPFLT